MAWPGQEKGDPPPSELLDSMPPSEVAQWAREFPDSVGLRFCDVCGARKGNHFADCTRWCPFNNPNLDPVIDQTQPGAKWEFDPAVTAAFDDMLRRSIPSYEDMRRLCFEIGCRFVSRGTAIVDLGCSRGGALAPFIDKYGVDNRYIGLEISPPMIEAAQEAFKGYIKAGIVQIRTFDLAHTKLPNFGASLILSVLTLQFTPIEQRQRIVRQAFEALKPGGALILVEKVLGSNQQLDDLFVSEYYGLKVENGYSEEDIQRKRLALEGVLVPLTASWNEELLLRAGFGFTDCFWRYLNFAAWIAVKV